ncbi:hypothetical protein OG921_24230 [Aldersonia sp. NBC_00410]|uniref:hypothetical protein n=1 Tax=Aldersonia sp. NBC_00410 TaxID=2975954 RepID=UPI00225B1332|nr:hypothetical protein [Aldersonia sp. NBC_00410]MCX5046284.1 hypothetical protein [Aldersonia sp. NBC_00410]
MSDVVAAAEAAGRRVQQVLADSAELSARFERAIRDLDTMRVRRPSEDETIVPEVDGLGRLTGLWLADGLCTRLSGEELGAAITAAINASNVDAGERREAISRSIAGDDDPGD